MGALVGHKVQRTITEQFDLHNYILQQCTDTEKLIRLELHSMAQVTYFHFGARHLEMHGGLKKKTQTT